MKNIKLENLGDKLVVELGLQDSALTVKILGKYLCYLCLTELSKVIDEIPKSLLLLQLQRLLCKNNF